MKGEERWCAPPGPYDGCAVLPLLLLLLGCQGGLLVRGRPDLIILVRDIGDVHPDVSHFVHGSTTPAHPLFGVRVVLVGLGVVVPGRRVNDGPLGEDWRRLVR